MSINRVTISGNLTRDPELRATASGMAVLSFSIANNERRKNNQTGEWENHPNYIDCTMFGTRAQSLSQYLRKGSKVAVAGKLHQDRWQDKEGRNRSKLQVYVDDLEFMSGQQQTPAPQTAPVAPMQQAPAPQCQQQQMANMPAPQESTIYAGDIPF